MLNSGRVLLNLFRSMVLRKDHYIPTAKKCNVMYCNLEQPLIKQPSSKENQHQQPNSKQKQSFFFLNGRQQSCC